jgi:hypothetical protein
MGHGAAVPLHRMETRVVHTNLRHGRQCRGDAVRRPDTAVHFGAASAHRPHVPQRGDRTCAAPNGRPNGSPLHCPPVGWRIVRTTRVSGWRWATASPCASRNRTIPETGSRIQAHRDPILQMRDHQTHRCAARHAARTGPATQRLPTHVVGAVREPPLQPAQPGARDVPCYNARGCVHGTQWATHRVAPPVRHTLMAYVLVCNRA